MELVEGYKVRCVNLINNIMPALNFQKQFAPDVRSGRKSQTIRAKRKHPIKEGDTLYLYTGMRTKHCQKLKEVKCNSVLDFSIIANGASCTVGQHPLYHIESLNKIAVADGFENWWEMARWFSETHSLPFEGDLITW